MVWFLFVLQLVHAAPIFESYQKILSGSVPTGYIIIRYEADAKGQLVTTMYTRTNTMGGDITEGIKAISDKKFKPVSFTYTNKTGEQIKLIDGQFKNGKLNLAITENGKVEKKVVPVKQGTFLSSFLVYLMLNNPKGLSKGLKYNYDAIAEEAGESFAGEAYIEGQETYKGVSVYKVLNTYKGAKFISFVTNNGEILLTKSPLQGVAIEMVASKDEAVKNLPFDTKSVALLFGEIPQGKVNILSKKADAPEKKEKGADVPAGKGIHTKSGEEPAKK